MTYLGVEGCVRIQQFDFMSLFLLYVKGLKKGMHSFIL